MSTKQTFVDHVQTLLAKEGLRDLPEGTHFGKAVDDAVLVFSRQVPYRRIQDYTSADGNDGNTYDFALPTGFSATSGISFINEIEYPTGEVPASTIDPKHYTIYQETTATYKLRLLVDRPSATETWRVNYSTTHTVDSTSSTIPAQYEQAVHFKAAELACVMMSAQHTGTEDGLVEAITVEHGTRAQGWRDLAASFRKQYESAMSIKEEGKVKAALGWAERDWIWPWDGRPMYNTEWN